MEHNSARVARELGFAFKYVLDEFYQNHKDIERKARKICDEYGDKTVQELKILVKDYNITKIKEEVIAKRSYENEQCRINKQKMYDQFSMSAATKRKAETNETEEKEPTIKDKMTKLENQLNNTEDNLLILDKQNLIQATEIKCLKREAEMYEKEKQVFLIEISKLKYELEKEKKTNQKLLEENILLKQALATPFFQQQKIN